jgi:hypothetical protein
MRNSARSILSTVLLIASLPAQEGVTPKAHEEIRSAVDAVDQERIEQAVRRLAAFGTRNTLSATDDPKRGIGAARRWLKEQFEGVSVETGGHLQVAFESFTLPPGRRIPNGVEVVNVVATLPGRDAGRCVIVSGHYDSMPSQSTDGESDAPGANDDASGTAVVLEAARVCSGVRPRATIIFLCVAGEEQGLLGSRGHAERARAENRVIEAMITNDIVGGVRGSSGQQEPMRVRLFSEGVPSGPRNEAGRPSRQIAGSDNDAESRQVARYLAARAPVYVPGFEITLIFRQDRFLRGGDHKPFNDLGYPGVRFTECHENYAWQHQNVREVDGVQYGDLPDNLDFGYVRRVCQANVAGILEIALAPAAPSQVSVMVNALTPHTELRWEANPEDDLAGYAVLYRRTHEPTWTHRRTLGKDATTVVMEGLSKDDWLFAVQAVDSMGRRSVPVYPTPSYGRRRGR